MLMECSHNPVSLFTYRSNYRVSDRGCWSSSHDGHHRRQMLYLVTSYDDETLHSAQSGRFTYQSKYHFAHNGSERQELAHIPLGRDDGGIPLWERRRCPCVAIAHPGVAARYADGHRSPRSLTSPARGARGTHGRPLERARAHDSA